jgi:putative NADH-flavin reductase
MRLTVFGASGGTGRRLLEQALGAGHNVTAVTRRPACIPPREWLNVVGADVADADAVDADLGARRAKKTVTTRRATSVNPNVIIGYDHCHTDRCRRCHKVLK